MSTSPIEPGPAFANAVRISADSLTVDLADGRSIRVPIAWYPRLAAGTEAERNNWRFIGRGEGIHWPDLDEDVSIASLLRGAHSGESKRSFDAWLAARRPE
jgi:hypothetical protein